MKNKEIEKVEEVAEKVILFYFQYWSQKLEDRIKALNDAVALAGIKAEFFQEEPPAGEAGWRAQGELEGLRAEKFREELEECWPLGKVEEEVEAVANLIIKTKKGGQDEE